MLAEFQSRINVTFNDTALLEQALTHSSYVNESAEPAPDLDDNQRLEFLGDAILDFLVGEWLYRRYPDAREGELTSLRAHLVRTESLAGFAAAYDLGAELRMGKGEAASGGAHRCANLCAAFEALIGAIYLDQGYAVAAAWMARILADHDQEIDLCRQAKDAKSRLQEYTQGTLRVTPGYRIVREEGPDHAKVFTAQAVVEDAVWGQGSGNSKQAAEQAAAAAALAGHVRRHAPDHD